MIAHPRCPLCMAGESNALEAQPLRVVAESFQVSVVRVWQHRHGHPERPGRVEVVLTPYLQRHLAALQAASGKSVAAVLRVALLRLTPEAVQPRAVTPEDEDEDEERW